MIRIELQVELNYDIDANGADFVFNIHAAQTACQQVSAESLVLSQPVVPHIHTDAATGTRRFSDSGSLNWPEPAAR